MEEVLIGAGCTDTSRPHGGGMTTDYKYAIFERANEIAETEFGRDFYELSQDDQSKVWMRAEHDWADSQMARADFGL